MKIKNILFVLLAVFVFGACNDDAEPKLLIDGVITLEPVGINELKITEDNLDETVLNLKWSAVDANVSFVSRYAIEVDTVGGDFLNGKLLVDTEELSVKVTGTQLNDFLLKSFKQEPYSIANYELRTVVAAKNKNGKLVVVRGSESESQQIKITTTKSSSAPEQLYMIGTAPFGNWNWSSAKVVTMIPVNGQVGEFWAIKYITKADRFKWSPVKDWKGDFAKLEELSGYEVDKDGNGIVTKDGLYMIYINYLKGKITIEPAKVNGMGDCFGGYTEGAAVFAIVDDSLAQITTKAAGKLRINASSSAQTSDWWTREFILQNGTIEYRGNDGDQPPVEVEAGKVITLNFNQNTGTIK